MKQGQLEKFRDLFDDYVAGFYGNDEFVNANLQLKEEHSRRTCDEMLYLAYEIGLSENSRRIAEVIALFHDIGRFEQFVTYRTYNDPRSVDHCLLGVEVLRKKKVLEEVQSSPDYMVYSVQPDFQAHVLKLALQQTQEAIIADSISLQENLEPSESDMIYYLSLTNRQRTKKYLHFGFPKSKFSGQAAPIHVATLKRACLREKTINHIIYHLTKE